MNEVRLDEDGRMPMNHEEYKALKMLMASINCLELYGDRLQKRLQGTTKDGWRKLQIARAMQRKAFDGVVGSMPRRKLMQVKAELDNLEITVDVRHRIQKPGTQEYNGHTCIANDVLEWMLNYIMENECLLCEKRGKQVNKCKVRRMLEATYAWDFEADGETCKFNGMYTETREE